jgi:hypothetical protein
MKDLIDFPNSLDHNFGKDDLLDRIEDIGPIVAEK